MASALRISVGAAASTTAEAEAGAVAGTFFAAFTGATLGVTGAADFVASTFFTAISFVLD